jgi:amino acid transporter
VVSAGSAGGYLAGEVDLPFPEALLTVFILLLFSGVCMFGIRESSTVALTIMTSHIICMTTLGITCIVRWSMTGNSVLAANWHAAQPTSTAGIVKQIFFGVSLGFLGNTGIPQTYNLLNGRLRIKPQLYRGSPSANLPQSTTKSLANVIHSIAIDDVIYLGRRSIFRHP